MRRRFAEEPDAKGMLLVTPTDYGTCGDIEAVAEVCHEFGKPLIVDEAWGAHLPFHPQLPPWAVDATAGHALALARATRALTCPTAAGGPAVAGRPRARDGDAAVGRVLRRDRAGRGRGRAGRISAEMITPYPPGAPAALPGEVLTREVLDYVRSGLAAGMQIPDPVDPELKSVRVVVR
ncbi:Orn/Lys/Arg family decarboxylase [Actinophytocola algeriensis]|uniref:Arginine/lysine/ornithine decarboxylase n=1 Tax=Actinophytocola algeriensis TaxID=1768010 RepID=A0A7W7Q5Q4_9PSEU|nr:hypothetical protein [Actinophytocola algeriensis]MBB4907566.1 arginine/lysine/ornithine decarboxylase [Actinophytocola algeriensis]MBE1479596.1 arginine/lysine/ornithine decarboxylase [Actinophytocola algeriensis]